MPMATKSLILVVRSFPSANKQSIGIYSPERARVDVYAVSPGWSKIAWEALRRWLARKGSKPTAPLAMAKHFHGAERAVREALGVVPRRAQIAHHLQVRAIPISQDAPKVDGRLTS